MRYIGRNVCVKGAEFCHRLVSGSCGAGHAQAGRRNKDPHRHGSARGSVNAGLVAALVLGLLFGLVTGVRAQTPADRLADEILRTTSVTGGVVVQLGCGEGRLLAALHKRGRFLVQGLDPKAEQVAAARRYLGDLGIYGTVTVGQLTGERLPYIDNMVNLVVSEDLGRVPISEVMRILCPGGMAYIRSESKWTKTVKPRPANIDDWTHYMHDASNNAVAHDSVVGPPRRLQWTEGPRYSRHHDRMSSVSAVVSAGGRVFSIEDKASAISILLPPQWTLMARDAFNGTLLWERPIDKWFTHLWPLKSGPATLPRRLVASGDRVYVTLGIDAPFAALDAATGKTVRTYEGTNATEEAVLAGGVLYLIIDKQMAAAAKTDLDRIKKAYGSTFWDERPRKLMAVEADTGKLLWETESPVLPGTLAANHVKVVLHNGQSIVCLDGKTGQEAWRSEPVDRVKELRPFYLPTLVLYEDVVLFSGGETAGLQTGSWYEKGKDTMTALSLDTGKELWSAYHPPSGYRSPEDLLVVDGLVWTGETTSGRATGLFKGRNPHTGQVVSQFKPDISTYWFHHRCYRGKATDKFLLMSRTGTEFVDVRNEHWDLNDWVRGACLYGVMPANGLLYAPRHPCACYLEAKLYGFNALAPATSTPRIPARAEKAERLEKGPAYNTISEQAPPDQAKAVAGDWPTYRHDAARTGHAGTPVPTTLKPVWRTKIGGPLSSPVVADGRLLVASKDRHTIHALDASAGDRLWQYMVGGRVDSPPTIYGDSVLFGSTDGYVYCLRASDGELAWRFRAAPADEQLVSYGQLESVWPVHGSVLVRDGVVFCVAGRSMFVDSGLRFWRLDARTGKALSLTVLDGKDEKGKDLQSYVSWLNMPPALPDILSCDGKYVYMRSQPFQLDGRRLPLKPMPHGPDADRGAPEPTQNMEFAHLFCPTGFLDDTWWHRSYWLYGSTFVSGWAGYYLSGKVAPAGRIMVSDDESVYSFGRKPQYFRWSTPIEYQLFRADKQLAPVVTTPRKGPTETSVQVKKSPSLNPAGTPLTVAAWVKADKPDGVILAHGGGAQGYALYLQQGRPQFTVRTGGKIRSAKSKQSVGSRWVHVAGVLTPDQQLQLFVNGEQVATGRAPGLLTIDPAEGLEIGADEGSNVGDYADRFPFNGLIDQVRLYHRALAGSEISQVAEQSQPARDLDGELVLAFGFDNGKAMDQSGHKNDGTVQGAVPAEGKRGTALKFVGSALNIAGYTVTRHWSKDLPLFVRAMVLSDGKLFVAGPPDVLDEEQAIRRFADEQVQNKLRAQLDSVEGKSGGQLWVMAAKSGEKLAEYALDMPPTFDGMAAARGRLYVTTIDGSVRCLAAR